MFVHMCAVCMRVHICVHVCACVCVFQLKNKVFSAITENDGLGGRISVTEAREMLAVVAHTLPARPLCLSQDRLAPGSTNSSHLAQNTQAGHVSHKSSPGKLVLPFLLGPTMGTSRPLGLR